MRRRHRPSAGLRRPAVHQLERGRPLPGTGGVAGGRAGFASRKKDFAVGEATAGALAASGIGASVAPGQSTAAAMAKAIGAEEIGGCSFLFPTGDLSPALAGSLRLLGAGVKTLIVYRTCGPLSPTWTHFHRGPQRAGRLDHIHQPIVGTQFHPALRRGRIA